MKYFTLIALLLLSACSTKNADNTVDCDAAIIEYLHLEVMEVHDESMLGLGEIKSLKKELIKRKKEVTEKGLKSKVDASIDQLILADSLMWDWMHKFKYPDVSNPESAKSYLCSEYLKIAQVDTLMILATEQGIQTLDKINAKQMGHDQ